MKYKIFKKTLIGAIVSVIAGMGVMVPKVQAASVGFSMSPMKLNLILNPGETYQTLVSISNPGTSEDDFSYKVEVVPFFVDDEYKSVFEEHGSYSMIVDWITLDSPSTGTIKPNESRDIHFTIDVPRTAPSGGQYASILVSSADTESGEGMTIKETVAIGHIIYAEITGNTVKQGEFTDVSVPGIILDGPITGSSLIKNTGNTHGTAKYTLQVFPLFSGEEVYSNEDEPETHTIIPDRTYYNETTWENTPGIGIFNVVYTVEYEGVTEQVSKMVIKCPIWIMFLVFLAVAAIVIWFFVMARNRRRARKQC